MTQVRASRGPLEDALLFIEHKTGSPFWAPLTGALLEVATSTFPIEVVDGIQWEWEAIHPGARLEAATDALGGVRQPLNGSDTARLLIELFNVVLEAYGQDLDEYRNRYRVAGDALNSVAEDVGQSQVEAWHSDVEVFDMNKLYNATVLGRFGEAFILRSDAPWIFWNPQLALHVNTELWNRFVRVTAPPLVLGPMQFAMPLAKCDGRYNEHICQWTHLLGTGQALVMRDLQRSGRLSHSAHFLRSLRRPSQFNGMGEDMILGGVRSLIGDNLLDQLLKESRLA